MPHTIVQLTTHRVEGDTMYRETWPMQALGRLPGFRVLDVHCLHPCRFRLAFEADLLLLNLRVEPDFVPILCWRRAKGKPTVLDLQNHMLEIEPWTPAFEARNDPLQQTLFLHGLGLVDLVQATTPFLAEEFAPYCSRIAVVPNQLPCAPAGLPEKDPAGFVVGWGGSSSHLLDLARIAPAVSRWIAAHADATLWLMSVPHVAKLFDLPPQKKRLVAWADIHAYEQFLDGVHVGLAPLQDTPFNRGRSDVKWLEYAAHGCVFLGQAAGPYLGAVEDEGTGFLFRDAAELLEILDRLYRDRSLAEGVRRAAFEHVAAHRVLEDHIHERADAYRQLLAQRSPAGGEAWNLDQQAKLPRLPSMPEGPGYWPIRLTEDEEKAAYELDSADASLTEESVALIEERFGPSHLTWFGRAVLAANRKDFRAAFDGVQRALSFHPASVECLALQGRALMELGRWAEAQQALTQAIQWHRAYVPAYVDLLGVLERQSKWELALAAAAEWERQCPHDLCARGVRGRLLIQSGQSEEGMATLAEAIRRLNAGLRYWQRPSALIVVQSLRALDPRMSGVEAWRNLIVEAAQAFPYSPWLSLRAGQILFPRGEYALGAQLLQSARRQMLDGECLVESDEEKRRAYRGLIEAYRAACEE